MAKTRNGVIAALDIGTSKVVCFVARVDGQGLRVVGIGHQPAQGMRAGNIVDMEAATRAISSAVSTAEEMCGEHVREVIVGVSGGSPASEKQALEVAIGHHEIGERDVRRVQQLIQLPAETADRDIIHSAAIGYTVDGSTVHDARGMFGERPSRDRRPGRGIPRRGPQLAGLRRARPRRHPDRHGRRHDLDRGLLRGPSRACRFDPGRQRACHQGHRARPVHAGAPRRAHEDPDRPRSDPSQRRIRHHRRSADRRGGPHASQPHPALDSGRHHPAAHRGDIRAREKSSRGQWCG